MLCYAIVNGFWYILRKNTCETDKKTDFVGQNKVREQSTAGLIDTPEGGEEEEKYKGKNTMWGHRAHITNPILCYAML